jgi:hypothetical protein
MPEPIFMKLDMYIMAPEPFSMLYCINPIYQSLCLLYVYPLVLLLGSGSIDTFPWQWIYATVEDSLETFFSVWSVLNQRKVYRPLYPPVIC